MQIRNEYYESLSTYKPQTAQDSGELSRVSGCEDTGLALDKSEDPANFVYRLMNGNEINIKREVLNSFEKSIQFIGG